MAGSGLHRDETAFNPSLGRALRHRNVQARITAETSGQMESALDQPDITVRRAGREPVLVENKYASTAAAVLSSQCVDRLGLRWTTGQPVKVVVGVRTAACFAVIPDADLAAAIETADDFEWASWTAGRPRLPAEGWLRGTVDELAAFVDRASEEAANLSDLTDQVRRTLAAAASQIENHPDGEAISARFGEVLYQTGGEQTNRMAMAVMFNAVLFQSHIASHHEMSWIDADRRMPSIFWRSSGTCSQLTELWLSWRSTETSCAVLWGCSTVISLAPTGICDASLICMLAFRYQPNRTSQRSSMGYWTLLDSPTVSERPHGSAR